MEYNPFFLSIPFPLFLFWQEYILFSMVHIRHVPAPYTHGQLHHGSIWSLSPFKITDLWTMSFQS